jgi:hypothetical protein
MQFRDQFLFEKEEIRRAIRPTESSTIQPRTLRQIISLPSLSAIIDIDAGDGQLSDTELSCIREGRS